MLWSTPRSTVVGSTQPQKAFIIINSLVLDDIPQGYGGWVNSFQTHELVCYVFVNFFELMHMAVGRCL